MKLYQFATTNNVTKEKITSTVVLPEPLPNDVVKDHSKIYDQQRLMIMSASSYIKELTEREKDILLNSAMRFANIALKRQVYTLNAMRKDLIDNWERPNLMHKDDPDILIYILYANGQIKECGAGLYHYVNHNELMEETYHLDKIILTEKENIKSNKQNMREKNKILKK